MPRVNSVININSSIQKYHNLPKYKDKQQVWSNMTSNHTQTGSDLKLCLPLVCNPFPHASLVPVLPCLTDSGTKMQGLHFCSFHL